MSDMIPTLSLVQANRDEILAIAAKYGVENVRIFGSVARGDATPKSDVDLLAKFPDRFTLVKWGSLLSELEDLLEHPVQLVDETNLRVELRDTIIEDARSL